MTGRIIKRNYLLILLAAAVLLLLLYLPVEAKEPQFQLNIDNTSLETGFSAELILSVENAQGAEVIEVQGLDNFDVLNKSHSSSTRITNGDMLQVDRYHFVIMPVSEGQFSLKGVVKYDGKEYETNRLDIKVKKGDTLKKDEKNDVFIKTIMGRKGIYFGEKVALGFDLYSRYNIENYGFVKQLDLTGFLNKEIAREDLRANYQYINGDKYVRYEVKKFILTPTDTGSYKIPSGVFQVNVSTSNFFDSSRPVYLHTDPVEIEVKPLPLNNQPDNFQGLVGELEVESSYNKQEINYGESVTLNVKLSGSCNLDNLDKIIDTDITGISIYETEKNSREGIQNNQYFASREFEIIIVPDRAGEIKIPVIEIPYFNPVAGEYKTAVIEGLDIQVNGGPEIPGQKDEENKIVEPLETVRIEQVNYTSTNNDYLLIQIKKTNLKNGLYILIGAVVLFLIIYFSYRYRIEADDTLRKLYNEVKKENDELELFKLLNKMIKYKYNVSLKTISRERLRDKIGDRAVLNNILQVMDYVENKKYKKDIEEIDIKDMIKEIYQKMNQESKLLK